jgi:pyruvate dehydrogenase E1 component alpha subunit
MDLLAVIGAVREAADRARHENVPTLLELITYRYRGHSMADPGRYRSEEEVKAWMEKDPIERFKAKLMSAGLLDEDTLQAYEREIQQEVADAVHFADASPEPGPEELAKYVYAEP